MTDLQQDRWNILVGCSRSKNPRDYDEWDGCILAADAELTALRARIALLEKVASAAINYRNNETRDNCEVLEEAIAALDAAKEG